MIRFQCPKCHATHERGYFDGASLFRCLGCGYQGDENASRRCCTDRKCGWEGPEADVPAGEHCPHCGKNTLEFVLRGPAPRSRCHNMSPAGYAGHWRDWHRGHGCELDPENKANSVGPDHYKLLIRAIDEAESELAVRANEYVAALRAQQGATEILGTGPLHDATLALKRAAVRRVDVFDKVYAVLGMERSK